MSDSYIFALDIGTRSVVGVVMQETSEGLEITAYEHLEHQTRAMVDGQIHDVEQVARVLGIVKERLENKTGLSLNQASVAAAGRALKTIRTKVSTDISDFAEISKEDILRLELQAVQQAQAQLTDEEDDKAEQELNYHCVGFSVVCYELDGYKISNLYGQKGRNIAVEVIATFLPRVVVDSMFSALNKIGVEMASLTLEPIAASTVVVPPSMRQLNIALVDIGAGTSDIAITSAGAVIGYGMVPMAGDEITEAISSYYLVDFNHAEQIKRAAGKQEEIEFTDILGVHQKVARQEILEVIADTVNLLTQKISDKIIELNVKTPQAVICIGGGSLTPLLSQTLSEHVGLVQQRVAVRGREAITMVTGAEEFTGPEAVTPIGIAVTAHERKSLGFARITFNERQIRLFEVNSSTVADAIMAAGVDLRSTRPSLGLALTLVVNGELKIIKGGRGKAALIKLNGEAASLDSPVKNDDVIEFVPAEKGHDATGYVYDVVPPLKSMEVVIDGEKIEIKPVITMNDRVVSYHDALTDNARILYQLPSNVQSVLEYLNKWNNEAQYLVYLNGREADSFTTVSDGDEIYLKAVQKSWAEPGALAHQGAALAKTAEEIHSEAFIAATRTTGTMQVEVNSEIIDLDGEQPILTDLFNKIDVSLRPPKSGMRFDMTINGQKAEFTSKLSQGDKITLKWAED